MNFIKALPVIALVVLFKYILIRLAKSKIRNDLQAKGVEDISTKFERMGYKCDIYYVRYKLNGEIVEKHALCDGFSGIRWL